MMAHGHKITSGYSAGVAGDGSETQYKRAQPSSGLGTPERRTRDGSKGSQYLSYKVVKALSIPSANTRQTIPWEESALYNEARVDIRKSACVAVIFRVRRTMAWHHSYFCYEMRRYAVAKRKWESRPTACRLIHRVMKFDDGTADQHVWFADVCCNCNCSRRHT